MPDQKSAVIITGACGGIGQALCSVFSENSYFVIATDKEEGHCLSDAFIKSDLRLLATNTSEREKIFKQVQAILSTEITLQALINNAANLKLQSLENLDIDEFRKTLDINTTAPMVLSKLFLPYLEASEGCVVNIGSIHSRLTKPDFVSYATSKAALLGLTRALAVDLGNKNVRVNVIQPAATATEMLLAGFKGKPDSYKQLKNYHPLGRIAEPSEIAQAALFLVTGKCAFISGAALDIDGGIGVRLHDPE